MSHEYRMEQLRAAIAAARKNFKKDANFFVVGLTYGCLRLCTLKSSGRLFAFRISLNLYVNVLGHIGFPLG